MDDKVFEDVRAILERNTAIARHDALKGVALYTAELAKRGGLHQSRRWVGLAAKLEEAGRNFIQKCTTDVQGIAGTAEGFALVEEALRGFRQFLDETYATEVSRSDGKLRSTQWLSRAADPISVHWKGARTRLDLEAAASRAKFNQKSAAVHSAPKQVVKNLGGKPLAQHWDAMWAAIAVDLYNGDLAPKTQADIEKAMADWLSDKEIYPSPSSIRGRARVLWQQMHAQG